MTMRLQRRSIDNSIAFNNVSLSGSYGADIYYVSNLDISGLHVTVPKGINPFNLAGTTLLTTPEPTPLLLKRRPRPNPQ